MTKTTLVELIYLAIIIIFSVLVIMLTLERNNLKWQNQELKAQITCIEKQGIWHDRSNTCFKK